MAGVKRPIDLEDGWNKMNVRGSPPGAWGSRAGRVRAPGGLGAIGRWAPGAHRSRPGLPHPRLQDGITKLKAILEGEETEVRAGCCCAVLRPQG